jgi:exodeoxyribonuclease (lambda-induced)
MIILNLEQGTDEWLKARLGVATASNFKYIVTSKGERSKQIKDYSIQLASEMLVEELEETYKSDWMLRGNELEDDAVDMYEQRTFTPVERVGFMHCGDYGYSPDGVVGDNGLIEVKCPSQKVHAKYLNEDRVPVEYVQQVQGGLYVSGRQWCDFISYNPCFKGEYKLFIKRVFRDEELIEKLEGGIQEAITLRNEYLEKIKKNRKELS